MNVPSRTQFESLLEREFRVEETSDRLTLRTVQALPSSARPGGGFLLEFVGSVHLSQATYTLDAGDGPFCIFLVPVDRQGGSVVFEAVFN